MYLHSTTAEGRRGVVVAVGGGGGIHFHTLTSYEVQ